MRAEMNYFSFTVAPNSGVDQFRVHFPTFIGSLPLFAFDLGLSVGPLDCRYPAQLLLVQYARCCLGMRTRRLLLS